MTVPRCTDTALFLVSIILNGAALLALTIAFLLSRPKSNGEISAGYPIKRFWLSIVAGALSGPVLWAVEPSELGFESQDFVASCSTFIFWIVIAFIQLYQLDVNHILMSALLWLINVANLIYNLKAIDALFTQKILSAAAYCRSILVLGQVVVNVFVGLVLSLQPCLPGTKTNDSDDYILLSQRDSNDLVIIDDEDDGILTPFTLSKETESPSILSHLYFCWIYPLIRRGHLNGFLEEQDLVPLDSWDTPENCFKRFNRFYQDGAGRTISASLFWSNSGTIFLSGFLMLISTLFTIAIPLTLEALLHHLENFQSHVMDFKNLSKGYILATLLFLSSMLMSITEHQFWIIGTRASMRCQAALMHKVFQKLCSLSRQNRYLFSIGDAINLISIDACRVSDSYLVCMAHWGTWGALFTTIVSIYYLWKLLGPSCGGYVLTITVLVLISTCLAEFVKKYSSLIQEQRDARSSVSFQIFDAIRLVKSMSWEEFCSSIIERSRKKEKRYIFIKLIFGGILELLSQISQTIAPVICFLLLVFVQNKRLDTSTAFSSFVWFRILQRPLRFFASFLVSFADFNVSCKRLEEFFQSKEIDSFPAEPSLSSCYILELKKASFSWIGSDRTDPRVLNDINLSVRPGELIAVVGCIGSGKSSLLKGILRECELVSGKISVSSKYAYVPSSPWILNGTIKENILFGNPYNFEKFRQALIQSALIEDLENMPDQELTEAGEEGVNLSGGQRQRIGLARAVYSALTEDADLILMDDVLSALDAKVSAYIWRNCICGTLKGKTRILVTHQTRFLSDSNINRILVLGKRGEVIACGSRSELLALNNAYINQCITHIQGENFHKVTYSDENETYAAEEMKCENSSLELSIQNNSYILNEKQTSGAFNFQILIRYLSLMGNWLFVSTIVLGFIFEQLFTVFNSLWLTRTVDSISQKHDLLIFSISACLICFFTVFRNLFVNVGGIKSGSTIHNLMVMSLLRAPVDFFDHNLTGRILNRLVSDQNQIDLVLPTTLSNLVKSILSLFALILVVCFGIPQVLIVLIVLAIPYYFISRVYRLPAQDLRRLEAISKSPINSNLTETIKGIEVIRAFRKKSIFINKNSELLNVSLKCYWNRWCANQWATVWLEFLGNLVTLACALFSVYSVSVGRISNVSLIGLIISYGIQIPFQLGWSLKLFIQAEIESVALERAFEYINIDQEDGNSSKIFLDEQENFKTSSVFTGLESLKSPSSSKNGTESGFIHMNEVKFRYGYDLPWILKGISENVNPFNKFAIVGRTGSGKSSLFQVLLRYYPYNGSLEINGQELREMDLGLSRRIFQLISQNPVLIGETLREVLCGPDVNDIDDDHIWNTLRTCKLDAFVKSLPIQLDTRMDFKGLGLSSGQKQLICIARSLIHQV